MKDQFSEFAFFFLFFYFRCKPMEICTNQWRSEKLALGLVLIRVEAGLQFGVSRGTRLVDRDM